MEEQADEAYKAKRQNIKGLQTLQLRRSVYSVSENTLGFGHSATSQQQWHMPAIPALGT